MKKLICIILTVSFLFLAACSGSSNTDTSAPGYGIYQMSDGDNPNYCKLYFRNESRFSIQYGVHSEGGACTIENGKLTVDIGNSDCFYVFDIENGNLVYNADKSSPSENFVADGSITDGTVFFLAHEATRQPTKNLDNA